MGIFHKLFRRSSEELQIEPQTIGAVKGYETGPWSLKDPAIVKFLGRQSSVTADPSIDLLYAKMDIFYRCVHARAKAMTRIKFDIMRQGKPLELTPIELKGMKTLRYRTEAALALRGANYIFHTMIGERIVGLRWLLPTSMKPEFSDLGECTRYQRTTRSGKKPLKPEEVTSTYLPALLNENGPGEPPAGAAHRSGKLLWSLDSMAQLFFQRGGIPLGFLKVPRTLPDAQRQKLEAYMKAALRGVTKAWEILALSDDVKFEQMSLPLKDLTVSPMHKQQIEGILTGFEVPYSMVISGVVNRAVSHQDKRNWYDETIIPDQEIIDESWNADDGFLGRMGLSICSYPEFLECFQAVETEKLNVLISAYEKGLIDHQMVYFLMNWPLDRLPKSVAVPEQKALPSPPDLAQSVEVFEEQRARLSSATKKEGALWATRSMTQKQLMAWDPRLITKSLHAYTKALSDQYGLETAFCWTKSRDAFMSREARKMEQEYVTWYDKQRDLMVNAVLRGEDVEALLASMQIEYKRILDRYMIRIFNEAAISSAAEMGIEFDTAVIQKAAAEWAREHAYERGALWKTRTGPMVQEVVARHLEAPKAPVSELRTNLEELFTGVFGPRRAELTAITEVTDAVEAAQQGYQKMLAETGILTKRHWHYTWSGVNPPCVICEPMDGQVEDENGMFTLPTGEPISGPSAHVKCCCFTTLEVVELRQAA